MEGRAGIRQPGGGAGGGQYGLLADAVVVQEGIIFQFQLPGYAEFLAL